MVLKETLLAFVPAVPFSPSIDLEKVCVLIIDPARAPLEIVYSIDAIFAVIELMLVSANLAKLELETSIDPTLILTALVLTLNSELLGADVVGFSSVPPL